MPKKNKQSALAWLLKQGVASAYTVILALTVGVFKWVLILVLFAIAWWEKIR